MAITEVKDLISEKLGWNVTDIYYICTDQNLFDFYLVYKNHRIKNLVALDKLNGCISGVWD